MAILKRRRWPVGQLFYDLRYRIGEYSLRGFIACLPYVPYTVVERFTYLVAWLTFKLLAHYRRRMEENVALTLGAEFASETARKDLVWRAWKNFARGVLDTTAIMHHSKERIIGSVRVQGEEHLQGALAKGKGVLALSAHLGSFTLIGARLAAAGYPFSVVVKHPADERFARLTDDYRAQVGIHTIPGFGIRNRFGDHKQDFQVWHQTPSFRWLASITFRAVVREDIEIFFKKLKNLILVHQFDVAGHEALFPLG